MRMVAYTFSIMILEGSSIRCLASRPFLQCSTSSEIVLGLLQPVRAVVFSPKDTLLAAAGDSRVIALYDVSNGDQVANLTGHGAWILSLDWSDTGEYLLSG